MPKEKQGVCSHYHEKGVSDMYVGLCHDLMTSAKLSEVFLKLC